MYFTHVLRNSLVKKNIPFVYLTTLLCTLVWLSNTIFIQFLKYDIFLELIRICSRNYFTNVLYKELRNRSPILWGYTFPS